MTFPARNDDIAGLVAWLRAEAECYDDDTDGSIKLRQAAAVLEEREWMLEIKSAQAYQVIGVLLDKAGEFESDEGQRALDYFSGDEVVEDFLPWPRTALQAKEK